MASNNGGPWGGGGGNRPQGPSGGDNSGNGRGGNRRPGDQPQIPEIDDMLNKGNEYLKVLMGGKGGGSGRSGGPGGEGPGISKGMIGLGVLAAIGLWAFSSFYTVKPEEQSVELFLGASYKIGNPGLNFAPWPFVSYEKIIVTGERTESIGVSSASNGDNGLMLTTDENIVDIDFQVVWNINNPEAYLFNLADPKQTVQAVSESSMREIIAATELAPILNRDRERIAADAETLIQSTLDSYDAGINIIRVNLDKADPPREVIDAFRDVQAAEQERDRLERQADAYSNTVIAGARGTSAQLLEEAEAYRAQVVNEAQGEASRFTAVLGEYQAAPEVTRKRLYLETIEEVYGGLDKIILDEGASGQGVVPYLPLNELKKSTTSNTGSN